MNLKNKSVELRTSEHTEHVSALQKSADFLKAFLLGFEIQVKFAPNNNGLEKLEGVEHLTLLNTLNITNNRFAAERRGSN